MKGIGMDLCEIARFERILEKGDGFLRRYFSAEEQAYVLGRGQTAAQSAAALFAAKEAFLKAAGIGMNILCISEEKLKKKVITDENRPDVILHRFASLTDLAALQGREEA